MRSQAAVRRFTDADSIVLLAFVNFFGCLIDERFLTSEQELVKIALRAHVLVPREKLEAAAPALWKKVLGYRANNNLRPRSEIEPDESNGNVENMPRSG